MNRHAILFGVEKYGPKSGLNPLTCPASDVQAMENLLSDPSFGGGPQHVSSHVDVEHTAAERELYRFLKRLERDDVAMIHFSGHGLQDDAGELYLCFTDTDAGELEITALAVADIRKMLDQARARKVLMTLDCCYSGKAGEQLARNSIGANLKGIEETFTEGTGIYVLSASGSTQTAKESKKLGSGVFTHHFVQGIRTGKADRDGNGKITVSEMAEYLQTEVPKDAANQKPHLSARRITGTFVIAENRKLRMTGQIDTYRQKLRELVEADTISFAFAGEVDEWLKRPDIFIEDPGTRWALLQKIEDGNITVGDFQEEWRAVARKSAKQPKSPEPAPPRPAQRQRIEHKTPVKADEPAPWKAQTTKASIQPAPTITQRPPPRAESLIGSALHGSLLWIVRMVLSPLVLLVLEGVLALGVIIIISEYNPKSGYDYQMSLGRATVLVFLGLMALCVVQIFLNWRHRKSFKGFARTTCFIALVMMVLLGPSAFFQQIVSSIGSFVYYGGWG